MSRISISKTDGIIIKYILRVVFSTVLSILLLTYICSQIIYKMDLSLDTARITGIVICGISSAVISFFSMMGIKNNGLLMGVLSEVPLIFYSLINTIFNNDNYVLFLIKLVIILLCGALTGYLSAGRNKKFRVK